MLNPELVLQAYEARTAAAIEDRLPLEACAISVGNNRHVLAIRVPNSAAKPHCVRYQGHVYFPSRRERHRYEMDIREIKEMVMRTASRLEEAEGKLTTALLEMPRQDDSPYLVIGTIPVFWRDFSVDTRSENVLQAVSAFDLGGYCNVVQPSYNFNGLERRIVGTDNSTVQVRRNGLIVVNRRIVLGRDVGGIRYFYPMAVDSILRGCMIRAVDVYAAAGITGPYLVGMMLRARNPLMSAYPGQIPGPEEEGSIVDAGEYQFPLMQADNLFEVDKVIRPLCDQAHQMFGRAASPAFNADGAWILRNG